MDGIRTNLKKYG